MGASPAASPLPAAAGSPGSVIPYDYGAKFTLTGTPGNTVEDVINITPEGAFVATAIGYGFEEDRGRELKLRRLSPLPTGLPDFAAPFDPGDITLKQIPPQALIEGFRFQPEFWPTVFEAQPAARGSTQILRSGFRHQPLPQDFADRILQTLRPPSEISFYFSIVDSGTGRELQDIPSHNLAALGKSNGERPFRPLAQPVSFMPRSTIRVQVVEASEGAMGNLYIVLLGYKVLGTSGCPEPTVRSLVESAMRANGAPPPGLRVIPFDYVSTVKLTGERGTLVEDEVPINVDGGFVCTSLGYALLSDGNDVEFEKTTIAGLPQAVREKHFGDVDPIDTNPDPNKRKFSNPDKILRDPAWAQKVTIRKFSELPLGIFPPSALRDGIKIRPGFIRLAFQNSGELNDDLTFEIANRVFQRLNRPEDASFLYTIFDTGTGREMQNMYLHNLAGLGIADGDRPFKKFAKPMYFQARSTIRVSVVEGFGRGKLYFTFQGYKVLGTGPAGRVA